MVLTTHYQVMENCSFTCKINWLLFKFRMGTQVPQLLQFRTTLSWLNLTYSYKLVLIVLTFDICVAMVI